MGGQGLIRYISVIKRVLGIVLMGTRPVLVNVTCWSPSDLHQPCVRTGSGRVMERLSATSGRTLEGLTALHLHPLAG